MTGLLRTRKRITMAVAATAVILSGGGLIASTAIKSPAQVAAQTAPPAPTLLTTPVLDTVVSQTILAQGVITEPSEQTGPPGFDPAAVGGSASTVDEQPLVTAIFVKRGQEITPGEPILAVDGRPLFAMPGTVPAYRNLVPGESGQDVAQLQSGLADLGFSIGSDSDGTFGPGTSAAVAALYRAMGYSVPETPGQTRADRKPMVPLDEIMFVPRLPARLVRIDVSVGGMASASMITLALGNPVVSGQLPSDDAGLVRAGLRVTVSNPDLGLSVDGTIRSVSATISTSGSISGGDYMPMRITCGRPLRVSLIGQDVQISIAAAHSSGRVLAVPVAAVFAAADGSTYVTKVTRAGIQLRVPVRVGVTGDGLVQVIPQTARALVAGDTVVTGEDYYRSGASTGSGGVG